MILGILPRPKQTTQLKLCLKAAQTKICIECWRPCSLCRRCCSHYNTKTPVCLSSLAARLGAQSVRQKQLHSSQPLNCKLLSGRRKKRSQIFWLTDSGRQLARQLLEPNVSGSCGETLAKQPWTWWSRCGKVCFDLFWGLFLSRLWDWFFNLSSVFLINLFSVKYQCLFL